MDDAAIAEMKQSLLSEWDFGGGELVKNSSNVTKVSPRTCHQPTLVPLAELYQYGLYDRPKLSTWHKGRVLLIGDAAHPTSPVRPPSARALPPTDELQHLGQGANQAFEDVDLLIGLLDKHNPSAGAPSTHTLHTVFTELEAVRIPRSAELVALARAQGEIRVLQGVDACMRRNERYREKFRNKQLLRARLGA